MLSEGTWWKKVLGLKTFSAKFWLFVTFEDSKDLDHTRCHQSFGFAYLYGRFNVGTTHASMRLFQKFKKVKFLWKSHTSQCRIVFRDQMDQMRVHKKKKMKVGKTRERERECLLGSPTANRRRRLKSAQW